ncbi:hypothetical protein IM792_01645 [Mucilaginibacter sp. JRF]|uniref:hypothetical protein n=1 Tax=Mucilaginibacter sp. JRF TaxID=2780088 RepID=UPI001881FBB0|nr:hypothetical protein [Mucilaginibacter sp. JRF]MBE9583143.1 hypothetical protein [Mucilaginibacter sp. JRF]
MNQPVRLEANTGNRIFYFTVDKLTENEVSIMMYNASYTFIRTGASWTNHVLNKFIMAQHLINEVVAVAQKAQ